MGKQQIHINNVPVSNAFLVEVTDSVIVCSGLTEEFFGISTIVVEGKDIICEHVDDEVTCTVRIDDQAYNNIPFRLIVDANANPKVCININNLKNPT